MIQSMTGYGKAVRAYGNRKINVEIKSLNSKAADISTRIAPLYREKELEIRQLLTARLGRGKIDFSLWIEQDLGIAAPAINADIVGSYYRQIKQIAAQEGIPEPTDWFSILLKMPEVTATTTEEKLTEDEWNAVLETIGEALDNIVSFRLQEGEALQKKFTENLNNIQALLLQIEPYEKERVPRIREQILKGLEQIPEADYNRNRLEQELIYYIEKLDINEEKQRLTNHLRYFRQTMEETTPIGKKLGFIAQEMGREINTTGSKSNHAEMQNLVVKMKDELEQIKEQVLNAL